MVYGQPLHVRQLHKKIVRCMADGQVKHACKMFAAAPARYRAVTLLLVWFARGCRP